MVESDLVKNTLEFFDQVFSAIPEPARRVEKVSEPQNGKKNKNKNKNKRKQGDREDGEEKGGPVSLHELKQKVKDRREQIQEVNRKKSQAKIKELTKMHQ